MMGRNSKTTGAAVGLAVFLVISMGAIVMIATTIRPIGASGQATYHATFTNASELIKGDQVRVAGVVVGRVTDVEVNPDARASVTFSAEKSLQLTDQTQAQIRYLNLIGDRYLALVGSRGAPLAADSTIPVSRTSPALDLNTLFNGFKPLFTALSPDDVNKLSYEIVQTLQGEGPTVDDLLRYTASLTSTLANRDVVIGRVVDNLNRVLGTLDHGQGQLNGLVTQLTRFMGGLAADRYAIGASIEHIDRMAAVTASLLHQARPHLTRDILQLGRLVSTLDRPVSRQTLLRILRTIPKKLNRITRSGSYGSWFNFYICDIRVNLDPSRQVTPLDFLFNQLATVSAHDNAKRCD